MKTARDIIIRPIITEHSYVKPRKKRVRQVQGYTRQWKKAMVTIAEGQTIEIFAS